MDRLFDRVLVRVPGKSYEDCVSKNPEHNTIDIQKAKKQHEKYVQTLRKYDFEVTELPSLEKFPDSIFVQDTALIGKKSNKAVMCRFGESSRRGEEKSISKFLSKEGFEVKQIKAPGTIEGGDILVTTNTIFIGISERTNEEGIDQLSRHFPSKEIIKVPVTKVFHLLSGVNYIGENTLAICPDIVDTSHFEGFKLVKLPKSQQNTKYSHKPINMLHLGDNKILLPDVYENTKQILQDNGYKVITLPISEFWKGDAGMTCPMLPFYKHL